MSEPLTLDPEVEAILREVAADPRSVLRMPSNLATKAFFEEDSRPTVGSTGLSSASQELLRVHRNEVAWLLRQACLIKLIEGPGKTLVSRYVKADEESELLSPRAFNDGIQLESLRARRGLEHDCNDALSLLARCVADPHDPDPSVGVLAAASFRLEPTNQGRLLAAIEFASSGREHTAVHTAVGALSHCPTDAHRTTALACIATALARRGRFESAHEVSRDASNVGEEHVQAHINCFVLALQAGLRRECLDASRRLDSTLSIQHPLLTWYVRSGIARRNRGEWSPTSLARGLVRALEAEFGPVSRKVANVFQ